MEKQDTIADTMRTLMATSPSVKDYPTYKSLNDYVGSIHGLEKGKCQALAGEKAWKWFADTELGVWRESTPEEFADRQEKAAGKNHGTRASKVLSDVDRAALDAQVVALETVNNPALLPLLNGLKAQQVNDDNAKKGSLKDRLQAAIDKMGLAWVVATVEA